MPNDPLSVRAFYSAQIAVSVKKSVADLIASAYAALSSPIRVPNITASWLQIQLDGGAGKTLLIGDENLSTTYYGGQILAMGTENMTPSKMEMVPLANIYLMSDDGATAVTVHILATL